MRKKTLKCIFDNYLWYGLYTLPLILLALAIARSGELVSLATAFDSLGLNLLTDNAVLSTLSDVFGAGGVLPLFQSPDMLIYLSYFICVYLLHLCVDVLLFIPRLCHRWLNEFTSGGAE